MRVLEGEFDDGDSIRVDRAPGASDLSFSKVEAGAAVA
jgi:hypothetical protein